MLHNNEAGPIVLHNNEAGPIVLHNNEAGPIEQHIQNRVSELDEFDFNDVT